MKRILTFALGMSLLLAAPAAASPCALLMQLPALCGLGSAPAETSAPHCPHANAPAPEKLSVQAEPENCCAVSSSPQSEAERAPSQTKLFAKAPVAKLAAALPLQPAHVVFDAFASSVQSSAHDRQALLCIFLS
ncbi:MAG TPA: hypothetical protein VNL38_04450 [Candidatus Nitrosotenuis sp.]|nr:hypothetical protein [Candidatus Nitrosotenuis sp.]